MLCMQVLTPQPKDNPRKRENDMKVANLLGALALLALTSSFATAYDPSPLQDICVAINDTDSAGIHTVSFFCHFSLFHLNFTIPIQHECIYIHCTGRIL